MSDRNWTITGYDGGAKVFETTVSVDEIAESDVKALLQRLAARHWSEEQTVQSSLSSDYREPLLEVVEIRDGPFGFTTDPVHPRYYVAVLDDAEDGFDDEDA